MVGLNLGSFFSRRRGMKSKSSTNVLKKGGLEGRLDKSNTPTQISSSVSERPEAGSEINGYIVTGEWFNGSIHRVCKAISKETQKPVALKFFTDNSAFQNELLILNRLKGSQNVVQIIDSIDDQMIIVMEYGVCDLHSWIQKPTREQNLGDAERAKKQIIRDIVRGLEECHQRGVVHTNLTSKNILLFSDPSSKTMIWKIIDFDTSRFMSSRDPVRINTANYCSPEVAKSLFKMKPLFAHPSIDLFSFGLILYFLETGHHYWKRKELWFAGPPLTKIEKFEILRSKVPLSVTDDDGIGSYEKRDIIQRLLVKRKPKSRRMTLAEFKRTSYYPGRNQLHGSQASMKSILQLMERDEDEYDRRRSKIQGEWQSISTQLYEAYNVKIPRLFIISPQISSWRNPKTWDDGSFRLYFACEHHPPHLVDQAGYQIRNPREFIKLYAGYIKLCHHVISGHASPDTFPRTILSQTLGVSHEQTLTNLFEEIGQIGDLLYGIAKEMPSISKKKSAVCQIIENSEYSIINSLGLKTLRTYIGTKNPQSNLTLRVSSISPTRSWLCNVHASVPSISSPARASTSSTSTSSATFEDRITHAKAIVHDIVYNAKLHPETEDRLKTASKKALLFLEGWNQDPVTIVDRRRLYDGVDMLVALFTKLMMSVVKLQHAQRSSSSMTLWTRPSKNLRSLYNLYNTQISEIINGLCTVNNKLSSKIPAVISTSDSSIIAQWTENLTSLHEKHILSTSSQDIHDEEFPLLPPLLSEIYIPTRTFSNHSPIRQGNRFRVTKTMLKGFCELVAEKSLPSNSQNIALFNAIEKEAYILRKYIQNKCEYLVGFVGITIKEQCVAILVEWAQDGDLNSYMKTYSQFDKSKMNLEWRLNIASDVARGVEFLHQNGIIHLDIRSHNILLTSTHHAKLSNFLWSVKSDDPSTYPSPSPTDSSSIALRRRYMDPHKLAHGKKYQLNKASDIFSLGIVFWELVSGKGDLPYSQLSDNKIKTFVFDKRRREIIINGDDDQGDERYKEFRNLIGRCWEHFPVKRAKIGDIVKDLGSVLRGVQPKENKDKIEDAWTLLQNGEHKRAIDTFVALAEMGNKEAYDFLAKCFRDGFGVNRDIEQAVAFFLKAASDGNGGTDRIESMWNKGERRKADESNEGHFWYGSGGGESGSEINTVNLHGNVLYSEPSSFVTPRNGDFGVGVGVDGVDMDDEQYLDQDLRI